MGSWSYVIHHDWKTLERLRGIPADFYISAGDQVTWSKGLDRCGQFPQSRQPGHFFCGHIHEAEGAAIQMGATHARNVGKRGYLLEL